jgi:hypothetical protein
MPQEQQRQSLTPGNDVKLQFEIKIQEDPELGSFSAERMWVKVTEKMGPYYIGKLLSTPACANEQNKLKSNDKITFLPEHIIDIFEKT